MTIKAEGPRMSGEGGTVPPPPFGNLYRAASSDCSGPSLCPTAATHLWLLRPATRCCGSLLATASRCWLHSPLRVSRTGSILGLNENSFCTGDDIARYLLNLFGENYFKKDPWKGSEMWYADQVLASLRIQEWLRKK
jgi:hypothetical protein